MHGMRSRGVQNAAERGGRRRKIWKASKDVWKRKRGKCPGEGRRGKFFCQRDSRITFSLNRWGNVAATGHRRAFTHRAEELGVEASRGGGGDQRTIGALRDELARLKGAPGRPDIKPSVKPDIKPSGMEKATEPQPATPGKDRRRGEVRAKLTINEERKLEADAPTGSRFKGYASFLVQDLVIRPHVTDFLRACWRTPDGKTVIAPLPPGVDGHFGPELRRLVLVLYHQGQVTAGRLVTLLRGVGVLISKRQVVRLLIAGKQGFLDEARDVLRAGLTKSGWITVDDTGARHKGKNGYCTQIGNACFTWFGTTASKSRLNFLELLRAGYQDYVVNDEALAYMRARSLAGPVIDLLSEHPDRWFADRAAWNAHLDRLGISALKVHPDPVRVATEGALWGSVKAHGFLPDTVIVSDDAGQFNVGQHGLCWIHDERLVHKLDTFTEAQRAAQRHVRGLIWLFYANLKAWRRHPPPERKLVLRQPRGDAPLEPSGPRETDRDRARRTQFHRMHPVVLSVPGGGRCRDRPLPRPSQLS